MPRADLRDQPLVAPEHPPLARPRPLHWLLAAIFASTLFTSAALIFLLEPMFAKMVLPLYGGSAEVWNTCILFFQLTLLGGYLYAHVTPRRLKPGPHAWVHVGLVALSLLTLPITLRTGWVTPDPTHPVVSLLALLLVSLGVPFLLLASTAPLAQSWFAQTDHPRRHDPYFLYAASNLGSLLALLAYPSIIEPAATLSQQRGWWAAGYVLLAVLIGSCVVLRRVTSRRPAPAVDTPDLDAPVAGVGNRLRLRWILLAMVPSSLMLGVTTYLTTDVAAVPLLWVIPLAIYLLTFVLAFARRSIVPRSWTLWAQIFAVGFIIMFMIWDVQSSSVRLLWLHLAAFAVTAMVCHGELARSRPRAERLTEYFLLVSLGGALGGVFNVLVAPLIFNSPLEYRVMLVLACGLRPATSDPARPEGAGFRWDWAGFAGVILSLFAVKAIETHLFGLTASPNLMRFLIMFLSTLAFVAWFQFRRRPRALALAAAIVLGGTSLLDLSRGNVLLAERNFYGTRSVLNANGSHFLYHGTTRHGFQSFDPADERQPTSYYSALGPLGDLFRELPLPSGTRRIAVVGLGAGTAAAYVRPGDRWTFYELDPDVVRMARDPCYFTYLSKAAAPVRVVSGDGRLSLAREPDRSFDLILVDAFNSDAIPVHMLTREAVSLYRRKLAPGGAIALHLSNQHLLLEPVVARLAEDQSLPARIRDYLVSEAADDRLGDRSSWAVLAETPDGLGSIVSNRRWHDLLFNRKIGLWTDDYSNVFQVFMW